MKSAHINQFPKNRTDQLIVKEVDGETLVYDLADDKAHCLNQSAALVWKNCDGKKSISEIKTSLAEQAGAPVDERVVWLALDQLEKFKLLTDVPTPPAVFSGMSRRQVMRNLGVAAVALPMIMSMAAPTAQAAASCAGVGSACGSNTQCCSNQCCGSPGFPFPGSGCPANNTCF